MKLEGSEWLEILPPERTRLFIFFFISMHMNLHLPHMGMIKSSKSRNVCAIWRAEGSFKCFLVLLWLSQTMFPAHKHCYFTGLSSTFLPGRILLSVHSISALLLFPLCSPVYSPHCLATCTPCFTDWTFYWCVHMCMGPVMRGDGQGSCHQVKSRQALAAAAAAGLFFPFHLPNSFSSSQ